ncbi:potassium channel family protein [Jiangella anatolica]|uniref:Two pore domain potassium channel family protein n=1 Tax=Jiangella anatolica TaxID=2670374 RepID=A0A2W2AWT4_9ACTN|nr:potassium channel family protein [Jiangella anatolica]PZF79641.1 two pore domain potassium channel family protein [Jiangella anatolica]
MIRVLRSVATLGCVVLVYYTLPLRRPDGVPDVIAAVAFAAGVGGLVWLTTHEIRRFVAHLGEARARMSGLLTVVYVVVMFFALTYYLLERADPEQFSGLETRTDALYFSVVTLGTVGYGDVHPVGQEARIAAMVQVVFDLVVIGALLAIASSQLAHRLEVARDHPLGVRKPPPHG